MIRFNKFPPEHAGDVELTEASRAELRTVTGKKSRDLMVAYGSSIAHTIVSSMVNPTVETVREVLDPVLGDAVKVLCANDPHYLAQGFNQGMKRELGLPPEPINKFFSP